MFYPITMLMVSPRFLKGYVWFMWVYPISTYAGWWLSHPSEKYEFVSWGYYSQLNG